MCFKLELEAKAHQKIFLEVPRGSQFSIDSLVLKLKTCIQRLRERNTLIGSSTVLEVLTVVRGRNEQERLDCHS